MPAYTFDSPIGPLHLEEEDGKLTGLAFGGRADTAEPETALLRKAKTQLLEYLEGNRKNFDLPLAPKGTPFMQAVWRQLMLIPYGGTASYGDIAKKLGNPGAARAVGMANNKNPLAIIIPCHRVIGQNRKLVGYAGGLEVKKHLLRVEGALL